MHAAGERQKLLPGQPTGHAAASGSALVLAELPLQFGLPCGGRQIRVTQLPVQQRRGCCKLLRIFPLSPAWLLISVAQFSFIFVLNPLHLAAVSVSGLSVEDESKLYSFRCVYMVGASNWISVKRRVSLITLHLESATTVTG